MSTTQAGPMTADGVPWDGRNLSQLVRAIAKWEDGGMEPGEEAAFFQRLHDSGMLWQLQGMYQRKWAQLVEQRRVVGPNPEEE